MCGEGAGVEVGSEGSRRVSGAYVGMQTRVDMSVHMFAGVCNHWTGLDWKDHLYKFHS